ncbi:hypothetical protein GCM10009127_08160 [Alteraurantiacibacter aestuarii]
MFVFRTPIRARVLAAIPFVSLCSTAGRLRAAFGLAVGWSPTEPERYGNGREWFGLRPATRKRERAPGVSPKA